MADGLAPCRSSAHQSQRFALCSLSEPAGSGTPQNSSPAGSRSTRQECTCCTRSAPRSSSLVSSAARSSVWMSRCTRPGPCPSRWISSPNSWPCSAAPWYSGVHGALGQRLARGCAPERQLTVVIGRRDVNHDLEQPAVMSHPANLRDLAIEQRIRTARPRRTIRGMRVRRLGSFCSCDGSAAPQHQGAQGRSGSG